MMRCEVSAFPCESINVVTHVVMHRFACKQRLGVLPWYPVSRPLPDANKSAHVLTLIRRAPVASID